MISFAQIETKKASMRKTTEKKTRNLLAQNSMREIKFRAWHKTWSQEEDDYVDGKGNPVKNGMQFVKNMHWSNRGNMGVQLEDWNSHCSVADVELMQYTGLKDKNGKEIYEGDIIRFDKASNVTDFSDPNELLRVVQWNDEEAQFYFYWIDGSKQTSGYTYCRKNLETIVEVIGNIYENPELLTNN